MKHSHMYILLGLVIGYLLGMVYQDRHMTPEVRLYNALTSYCAPIEYRDIVCQVQLPQGFGEDR